MLIMSNFEQNYFHGCIVIREVIGGASSERDSNRRAYFSVFENTAVPFVPPGL